MTVTGDHQRVDLELESEVRGKREIRINDFSIRFANINGTGSASVNNLVLKAIFRMGIPVSGKNLFPSNIQGLPTWYEIRVNEAGHLARATSYDLVVAMNGQTYADDMASARSGGYFLYDSSWPLSPELYRDDVTLLGVPLSQLCSEVFSEARSRVLLRNVAYAGAVAALLDIDHSIISALIGETYSKSAELRSSNQKSLNIGYDYVKDKLACPLPVRVESRNLNVRKILIDGNTATALGCLYAGATVAAWYPITPATSVSENFLKLCERYRTVISTKEDGTTDVQNNFAVVQAEDEIAALGMVIGASWAGARAFTSTSGPGISLMNELLGLAYYSELPAVVIDVQRTGPSTGMPTRVQQADLLLCAYASHGDTKHILLFPADPRECFDFAVKAFDLAEHFQTPVMVLSDLDVGMNEWVTNEFEWDDSYQWDRGRLLSAAELDVLGKFYRYCDPNEDFVTPRTIPGKDSRGAYFTRGSGHDKFGGYTEQPEAYREVVERLAHKHASAARSMPEPVVRYRSGASYGVITIGSCKPAVVEALDILESDGITVDYLRVRGFPFQQSVKAFIEKHEFCIVVEQNRDAQLRSLLILELGIDPSLLYPVTLFGGFPLSTSEVLDGIKHVLKG